MPPKKKQPPRNAFYFYMVEKKGAWERTGERFPGGMKEVADLAGPLWASLSAEEKKPYEDMAKAEKIRAKGDTARKYTNQHNSFDYMDRTRAEEEEARLNMCKKIESTIISLKQTGKIAEFKFYLIHVNYFCITEGNCYHPAEIAVAEFSLAEGVTDVYHAILNSGSIPLGYRHDAMLKSETVHYIPLEPEFGEKQMHKVWEKIKAVLQRGRHQNGGMYPPMYTMPDNVNLNTSISCVKSVVQTLCDSVSDNPEDFPVYALEKLCFELKNMCARESKLPGKEGQTIFWPSIPFACSKLEEDIYNFTPEIACSFHYDQDQVVNCSKSFVQRWAYLICDECCQYVNVALIPGKHVPLQSDVNYKHQFERRERERRAEEEAAKNKMKPPKPFQFIDYSKGQQSTTFKPVQPQHPPLPQPTIVSNIPHPRPQPPRQNFEDEDFDFSDSNFPSIVGGRGRGRNTPSGAAPAPRGRGPMSFAAAMQSRK